MADSRYFPGSTVSRWLPTQGRSWDGAVYQSGKPILDSEMNLSPEISREINRLVRNNEVPSGFLRGPSPMSPASDFRFPDVSDPDFFPDSFYIRKRTAIVAGMPVVVEYTDTTLKGENLVLLETAPLNGGSPPDIKRTDFVFLEVFRAQVETSPRATDYLTVVNNIDVAPGDVVNINGVPLTATNLPPAVDEFLIGASESQTAANIAAAVNLSSNSFTGTCSAQVDIVIPERVNFRASDSFAGLSGNALTLGVVLAIPGCVTVFAPNFSGGADTLNKPTQASLYVHGNVLSPSAVGLPDDIADPAVWVESTKRVQVQYRIRKTGQSEAVNFKTENGFSNGNVEAQGSQASPVGRYRFIPADGVTVEAFIEVTGVGVVAVSDTITLDGVTLTAVAGVPVGPQFDVSSGVPATIATSITAAITGNVPTVAATTFGNYIQVVPATPGNDVTLTSSLTTSTSVVTTVNSAVAYGDMDGGLFISGNGTQQSASDLGTVDGFSYAIPICFVFRRNDASGTGGFDPLSNTNGAIAHDHAGFLNTHGLGAIPAGVSDRPDNRFHDVVVYGDILDLRRHVSPGGVDLKAELESQMSALLDGGIRTWALDTQGVMDLGGGSGDVSPVYLVCNEIGDQDTTRGQTVGTWDHIRRRFGDQSVVERRVFPVLPSATSVSNPGLYVNPPLVGWQEGQIITIDFDNLDASGLGDWAPTGSPIMVSNQWPAGTKVTNVLRILHDDGNYAGAISQNVEMERVIGIGTNLIEITLAPNNLQANGGVSGAPAYDLVGVSPATGSPRRVFVELEITYPVGEGISATPDELVFPDPLVTAYKGSAIENDTSKRPTDWEDLIAPQFRTGYREMLLEYVSNEIGSGVGSGTQITESIVSQSLTELVLPRRFYGSSGSTVTVTEQGSGVPTARAVNSALSTWGSSESKVVLGVNLSAAQSLCDVEFFAQDPIPDFSSPGDRYQISVYFRSNAPQTIGVQAGFPATSPLPASISLRPLAMSRDLWTGTVSSGSLDLGFPYSRPLDQIAVNADLEVGPSPSFPGEWVLSSTSKISVGNFDSETGLLNLHQVVPVDPNSTFTFQNRDWDGEFRGHYKVSDLNSYRPTAMAQPLSSVATHKVWFPFLAQSTSDNVYFRKGEVLLVVVSRFAKLDGNNTVVFSDSSNESCAAVYRTNGLLILASEQ